MPGPLTARSKGSSRLHSWEVAEPGRESRPFHAKCMLFILYYQHCKKSVKAWLMSSKNLQYFVAGISQPLETTKPLFPQRTKTTIIKTRLQLSNYTILLSNSDCYNTFLCIPLKAQGPMFHPCFSELSMGKPGKKINLFPS